TGLCLQEPHPPSSERGVDRQPTVGPDAPGHGRTLGPRRLRQASAGIPGDPSAERILLEPPEPQREPPVGLEQRRQETTKPRKRHRASVYSRPRARRAPTRTTG